MKLSLGMNRVAYRVSKHRALQHMARQERPGHRVVVFTMGKTGNKSVAHAIRGVLGTRVFRIHRLTRDRVQAAERRYRQRDPATRPLHLWESEYLLGRPPTPVAPWDVVTMVREPIAQAVAAFFQSRATVSELRHDATVESLVNAFIDRNEVRRAVRWFDREFKTSLGVDVYAYAFEPERGCCVIETPGVRVLILRTESMSVAPHALAEFFGLSDPVALPRLDISSPDAYAATHEAFLRKVHIPGEMLRQAYGSRYAQHFYDSTELDRFRSAWERTQPEAG